MVERVGKISTEMRQTVVIPTLERIDGSQILELPLRNIVSFSRHPFKVIDDESMNMLKDSIKEQGIMTPIIVRRKDNGKFEVISGHRRVYVARELGFERIMAIIKDCTDDEAIIAMVDSNLQRELLPSEKAYAFKMRMDAIKHQGTSRRGVAKSDGSAAEIGFALGISGRQVQRYIKLTGLSRKFLELVDNNQLSIELGGKISVLSYDTQDMVYDYVESGGKLDEELIRLLLDHENRTGDIYEILESKLEKKIPTRVRVSISKRLINRYFPDDMSDKEILNIIETLLHDWSLKNS